MNRCFQFHCIVPKPVDLNYRAIDAKGGSFIASTTLWMPQLNVPLEPAVFVRMLGRSAGNAASDLNAAHERPKIESRKCRGDFCCKGRCAVFMIVVATTGTIP
jgi:hypothetical protein